MNLPPHQDDKAACAAFEDALGVLLHFGAAMLGAGGTAGQARRCMDAMARQMGFDALAVSFSLRSVIASARRGGEQVTMMREVEPPSIDASQIGALERLAQALTPGEAPENIAAKVAQIEGAPAHYSVTLIAVATGVACGAFAFLNGGGALEITGAAIGSGIGQWIRSRLPGARLNQYGVTMLAAIVAAGAYGLFARVTSHMDLGLAYHASGSLAAILFLLPGFPLVTALLDMLQYQTLNAMSRFAHGVMIVLAAAFGFSIISAVVGFEEAARLQPVELTEWLKLLLRGIASFASAYCFAMLYNSSPRALLAVGILAAGANEFRLGLVDGGMTLPAATFLGSLVVGLATVIVHRHVGQPLIAIAVPGIIIMMPGSYVLQALMLFHQGQTLDAIRAAALAGFVLGAMAAGLAVARLLSSRWEYRMGGPL